MNLDHINDIAVSGLIAQRARLATTASNLANAQTTRSADGGPYQRRDPLFVAEPLKGSFGDHLARHVRRVRVSAVVKDPREPITRFDPGHPDADDEGIVRLPRIDSMEEMANLLSAQRSYEANLLILRKSREMGEAAMRIGR